MNKYTSLETSKKIWEEFPKWRDTFASWEWAISDPPKEAYIVYPDLEKRYGLWGTMELKGRVYAYDADYLLDKLSKFDVVITYTSAYHRYDVVARGESGYGLELAEALASLAFALRRIGVL